MIVARLLRKLGNSIYQRWDDGQTVAAQDQTFKRDLILQIKSKEFQFCLFSYMMMHINRRLLPDRRNIPKASHPRHGGIAFRILTVDSFSVLYFNKFVSIIKYFFSSGKSKFREFVSLMNNVGENIKIHENVIILIVLKMHIEHEHYFLNLWKDIFVREFLLWFDLTKIFDLLMEFWIFRVIFKDILIFVFYSEFVFVQC